MKRILLLISLVLPGLTAISQNPIIKQVNPHQFQLLIKNPEGILLDVRTQSEFGNGHIPNSGQLNYYALDFRRRLLLLPKNEPIYLYCNTGYRSQKAAEILAENGYSKVYNLEHGMMDWELKNLAVVVEPDAHPEVDNKMDVADYSKLIQSDGLVFIDFYAPWCAPCRKMLPMMDSLKVDYYNRINLIKVNVDASKNLVKELKLISVPYLVLFRNGKVLFARNGAVTRDELTTLFQSNLSEN